MKVRKTYNYAVAATKIFKILVAPEEKKNDINIHSGYWRKKRKPRYN